MSEQSHTEQSDSLVPGKGVRVRVTGSTGGLSEKLVGRVGWVERFFVGHIYSVGVALDDDNGVHAFRPEELTVIR